MPATIGQYIKNRRLELRLEQKDLAGLFKVSNNVVSNWELDKGKPNSTIRPKIVQFLGYIPWEVDTSTFGGRLEQARLLKGFSMTELADLINESKAKISRLERNIFKPKPSVLEKLYTLLGDFNTLFEPK